MTFSSSASNTHCTIVEVTCLLLHVFFDICSRMLRHVSRSLCEVSEYALPMLMTIFTTTAREPPHSMATPSALFVRVLHGHIDSRQVVHLTLYVGVWGRGIGE